jgi:hypothetical protein
MLDMPTVWIRSTDRPRFHRTEDCYQLNKPPARGTAKPVRAVELANLNEHARPCRVCYPDAPHVKVVRRFCPKCNTTRALPCAHNGGVRVTLARTTSYVSLLRDPGDEWLQTLYVWPDQAWFYEPQEAIAS